MENLQNAATQIINNWGTTKGHNAETLSRSMVEYSEAITNFKVNSDGEFESCKSKCGYNSVNFKLINGAYCPKCGFVFPF